MEKQLKYVKGSVQSGYPADIYFYTDVDYWSVDDFLWEFKYLIANQVSKINIHINSAGGSCVDGISVFSRILDCQIPTACYNDGLAASMGSVIWAAGDEVFMKDYALLMIHNPFMEGKGEKYNQITEAFKKQLSIIYQKRFNMSEEDVNGIMNGKEGCDGTFFTSSEAIEKGFISEDHVIETPEAERGRVESMIKDKADLLSLKGVMNSIAVIPSDVVTIEQEDPQVQVNAGVNINHNNKTMNEKEISVFAAIFGLTGDKATVENVSAQISEVKAKAEKFDAVQAELEETKKLLGTAKTELQGANASVANLTADLQKANDALKVYQEAEVTAKAQRIDALVEEAIAQSKIDKADKETWVKMAENDFDLAKQVLDKIPARQDLSAQVAAGSASDAQQGMKSEEEKLNAKVDEVVGKDFQFRTLD